MATLEFLGATGTVTGSKFLVEAAGELSRRNAPIELVIAGRGDLEEELRTRARALGVSDRVRLVGNVERGELPSYFALADVVAERRFQRMTSRIDSVPPHLTSGTQLRSWRAVSGTSPRSPSRTMGAMSRSVTQCRRTKLRCFEKMSRAMLTSAQGSTSEA